MSSVSAHDVMGAGLAGVDERAVKDQPRLVGAGALQSFMDRLAKGIVHRDGVAFDPWDFREFLWWQTFHFGLGHLISDRVLDGYGRFGRVFTTLDEKGVGLRAVL